ncbi:hypothetical protein O181_006197 [Austropuccinia psidii MF-1]|uniref:LIM zinc-binding domain-containing protein n=1 Tax=Austropuccinia psidii MF-1 TaxID=1389203 RepID=A0A9Q3GHD6_9BASI|nr:hypothetical protein [Austropuccinia psidii MF-1]
MAGFCRRCGDIIRASDTRCKCGGSSATSPVTKAMFESSDCTPKKPDRWLKTYGERRSVSPATSPFTRSQTRPIPPSRLHNVSPPQITPTSKPHHRASSKQRESLGDCSLNTLNCQPTSPPTPPSPSPIDLAKPKEVKRGLSVKSSARAHVRSLTANIPDSVDLSAAEEEVLTNVFGSVLDPHETRGRCGACQNIFKREGKIYPDPRRDDESGKWAGVFYCRSCYVARFSRGACASCHHTIVGDEGGFIQLGQGGQGGLWHKKCFKCVHCKLDLSHSPIVDLRGDPCCNDCFDKSGHRSPSFTSSKVTDIPDLRTSPHIHNRVKRISVVDSPAAKMIKPAVEELRSKLRKVGVQSVPLKTSKPPGISTASDQDWSGIGSKMHSGIEELSKASQVALDTPKNLLAKQKSACNPITSASSNTSQSNRTSQPRPGSKFGSASTRHILSPSVNPICPTCKQSLFKPIPDAKSSKSMSEYSDHFGGTLATLPATGETFHIHCFTCDDCKQPFKNRKYVLLDSHKLCEECVGQRDLAAAQEKLRKMKEDLMPNNRRLSSSPFAERAVRNPDQQQELSRSEQLRPSFPPTHPLSSSRSLANDEPIFMSASSNKLDMPFISKKVSSSPFLGGQDGLCKYPKISTSRSTCRFGGQTICPGCSKPGTITETKPGPNNERWHLKCLKCAKCNKLLDSGAKRFDGSNEIGCKNCLVQAGMRKRITSYTPLR